MFNGESGYSLSDIAAVSGKNNENMWNDGGAWWIIILFLFCFAGWGGNGWGSNNGSTTREDITYGVDMRNRKWVEPLQQAMLLMDSIRLIAEY